MIFALAGNQNCGKTTLFNALTGSNQHVGNFPGVTVDRKSGEIKGHKNDSVVDLPGIYSLRPYTQEEFVTRDFIINEKDNSRKKCPFRILSDSSARLLPVHFPVIPHHCVYLLFPLIIFQLIIFQILFPVFIVHEFIFEIYMENASQ